MLRNSWAIHSMAHIDQQPRNAFFLGVVALFEILHLHLRLRLALSRRAECAMSSCSHASLVNSSHVILLCNPAKSAKSSVFTHFPLPYHVIDSAEQPAAAVPFTRDRWVVLCFVPRAVLLTREAALGSLWTAVVSAE
jgi:hypothetical protein